MTASYHRNRTENQPVTCALCGRMLGMTFHFACHVCGTAYCYVHMPEKCIHTRTKAPLLIAGKIVV